VSAGGGTRAVIAALAANAGIAAAKFVGFLFTGSSSMLAESVHSLVDTVNQGLLLVGKKRGEREATPEHPFGYGRDRYFYGFVVALLLFTLGAAFSVYEGVHKILEPRPVEDALVAFVILGVAIGLELFSFRTAMRESRPLKGEMSWWQFIRRATEPELPVVLLEDFGALIGLLLALIGVGLTVATGNGLWDGIGTVAIGVLLGALASILIVEMKSLLIGEGADPGTVRTIVCALEAGRVQRLVHLRTQYLGPNQLLVAAKIALTPGLPMAEVARTIDDAEERVRSAVPAVRLMYLEPDLDRDRF
jgi:cation diffusion facilitator family transporter